MTLPAEKTDQGAQNSISMSQVNVELFFEPNTPISLNQVSVRNLFQKPDDQTRISLWDGFGKSNIGKPKNPVFTVVTQVSATVSWGASDGICNKYTVTVTDAATDTIVYGTVQNFTTIPLALTANLTGLTVLPIISAAGTPTATTFNSVSGYSVAFTYSTNGVALTANTWYRIAGNSNTSYNKVVQVISSADATHAVLFYPGTSPGTWGSGQSTIVKIETITSAGAPVQYTHNSVPGYSVSYVFTSLGSALTVGSWYRIEGNSNAAYNNYVQVISSADDTHATVFYRTNPGTYGSGTTTIVDDSKTGNKTISKTRTTSSAGTPTATTFNSVSGYSVMFAYPTSGSLVSTAGVFLAANSWCQVSGNSNPAYNQYVQVISSPDAKHTVVFYPTNPGIYGTGTTVITTSSTYTVHLLASNTLITPTPVAETLVDLLTLEYVPLTPTTPVVDVISKNILRVTANATYATSYDIYEVISGTDTLVASSVQMPYDHTVLTYSLHTYKVKGRSTGGVGPISSAAVATRSLPDFPVAVPAITFTVITSSSVKVGWTASTSPVVINYRVIATLADAPYTEVYNSGLLSNALRFVDASATSSPAATFNPATLYQVTVLTINEAGHADTVSSFTTKTAQPGAPTATATSQTAITVTWGTTFGASSYILYKDGSSIGTQTSPYNDNSGVVTYSLHSYQVSAVNVSGESVLSNTTQERSWPELPVAVTNVVLTPDMNSIAAQWTLSATTSIRTADNYRVYTYLKTNMATPVDTSPLLSSTTNTYTTGLTLVGWTQYTIRIYTYNRAGSVFIDTDMTTLADTRPDPLSGSIGSFTNQEPGATNIQISQVTIGTFQPGYNTPGIAISTSTGQFQAGTSALTTGWVTSATVVPDSSGNIVFQARMNASANETSTVTSTFTIGGGTRTLSVTTRDPNPPSNVTATGGTGIATISWTYNSLYTYTVTADTGQSKTGISSGSVVLGDSASTRLSGTRTFYVYARNSFGGTSTASNASAYVTPMPLFTHTRSTSSVNEGSSASFGISTTNVSNNSSYTWSISGVSASDFSSMSYSDTNGASTAMSVATSGSFKVYGSVATVSFTMAMDHLTEGTETMTFSITGSPTGDFSNGNISMTVGDLSLDPDLTPTPRVGDLPVRLNCALLSEQTTSVVVQGVEPNWPIPVSCLSGSIFADGMAGYATSGYANSNSSGQFTLNLKRTASGSNKTAVSMEFSVGGTTQGGWSIVTIPDEVFTVGSIYYDQYNQPVLPVSVSGANDFDTAQLSIIDTTGRFADLWPPTYSGIHQTITMSGTGTYSMNYLYIGWGTYRLRTTFTSTGHVRYSGTITVNPDTTPDSFSLSVNSGYSSSPTPGTATIGSTTVTGLSAVASVTVSWSATGFVSGSLTAAGTTISSSGTTVTTDGYGQLSLSFSATTSSTFGGSNTASITVGTVTNSTAFSVTNRQADTTPNPDPSYANATGVGVGNTISSDTFTVSGLEPNYSSLVISASGGSISARPAGSSVGFVSALNTSAYVTTSSSGSIDVFFRLASSSSYLTTTSMTYSIGTFSGTWSVTTLNVAPGIPTISSMTSTATSISISWSASSSGGTPTTWEVSAVKSGSAAVGATGLAASTRSYTFTGLSHSSTYSITVAAANSIGATNSSISSKATTTPSFGTFAWNPTTVANGGSSTFSGSLIGGAGLTGIIDVVDTTAGTWNHKVINSITSDPQTISWTLSAASYTATTDHAYYAAAYFQEIGNFSSGTKTLTVSAPVAAFSPVSTTGSISANTPWNYSYTATHTRTYTFTVTGSSAPFDVVLTINGTPHDSDNVRGGGLYPNIGETYSQAFNANDSISISVRGFNSSLAGSFSFTIT